MQNKNENNNKKGDFKPSVTFTAQNKDGKKFNIDADSISEFINSLNPETFEMLSEQIRDRKTLLMHNWIDNGNLSALKDIFKILDSLECLFLELNFKEKTN